MRPPISIGDAPPNVAGPAPTKRSSAPAVSPFVLKSSAPPFVRSSPTDSRCAVTVPVAADWNVPPATMLTLPFTVSVRAVVASNCSVPEVPCPTVKLLMVPSVSIVTVQPSAMVTLSVDAGTTPPLHVPPTLQLPPAPAHETSPAGRVAWLPVSAVLARPSVTAYTCQK